MFLSSPWGLCIIISGTDVSTLLADFEYIAVFLRYGIENERSHENCDLSPQQTLSERDWRKQYSIVEYKISCILQAFPLDLPPDVPSSFCAMHSMFGHDDISSYCSEFLSSSVERYRPCNQEAARSGLSRKEVESTIQQIFLFQKACVNSRSPSLLELAILYTYIMHAAIDPKSRIPRRGHRGRPRSPTTSSESSRSSSASPERELYYSSGSPDPSNFRPKFDIRKVAQVGVSVYAYWRRQREAREDQRNKPRRQRRVRRDTSISRDEEETAAGVTAAWRAV